MIFGTKKMLIENDRIGKRIDNTGLDTYESCFDKEHFKNYNKKISYEYNSKGFRDVEWPTDLSDCIWCIGDSFTEGLGQPFEETWPQVLQKSTGKTCINLGVNGASAESMRVRAESAVSTYKAKNVVIMWSFIHRRRVNGRDVHYDDRSKEVFNDKADLENFLYNFNIANSLQANIVNTVVPKSFWNERMEYVIDKKTNNAIINFEQVDYARDGYHFDILTCQKITDLVAKNLNI